MPLRAYRFELKCTGDLDVDAHHTVEDCGICLGQAIARALGDKAGIMRVGSCMFPMDFAPAILYGGREPHRRIFN